MTVNSGKNIANHYGKAEESDRAGDTAKVLRHKKQEITGEFPSS